MKKLIKKKVNFDNEIKRLRGFPNKKRLGGIFEYQKIIFDRPIVGNLKKKNYSLGLIMSNFMTNSLRAPFFFFFLCPNWTYIHISPDSQ